MKAFHLQRIGISTLHAIMLQRVPTYTSTRTCEYLWICRLIGF